MKQAQKGNVWYQAEKILRLQADHSADQIDQALAQALTYGAWGCRPIENICRQRRAWPEELADQPGLIDLTERELYFDEDSLASPRT